MISRRDAIIASFGLAASSKVRFAEHEENQIIYVLRYPPGSIADEGGNAISTSEIARDIVTSIRPGSRIALPGDVDCRGEYCWELKVFDLRRSKMQEVPNSLKQASVSRNQDE